MKRLTLQDCTKEDLIWIINRVLHMVSFNNADYYIKRALSDLSFEKEKQALDEADKIAEQSKQKWDEYLDVLAPYNGTLIKDIPQNVLKKAQSAYNEAIALDKKWNKMMGIVGDTNG